MYQIKLLNKISPLGLSALPKVNYTYGEDVENPQGIIVRSAKMHDLPFGPELLAIARAGAGVNNIPIPKCSELGIAVFNTPGANANAVKELTILGLLLSARNVFPAMQWAQELKGKGEEVPALVEKGKSNYTGPEIKGKKLGVIGLGMIGVLVTGAAVDLGMEVYGYDPFLSPEADAKIHESVHRASSIREIYSECDFISLHLPSTGDTRGMINAETLSSMKKGVRILNFARGDLVAGDDILAALDEGQVGSYLTDFPDDSMLGHTGVLALPHLGASTPESEENCAIMAANQMRDYLENGNIENSVNLPSIHLPRSGKARILVIHKNVPNMIAQISGTAKVNIDSLVNASKGDMGCVIMDLDSPATKALLEDLGAIEDVVKVRYFE